MRIIIGISIAMLIVWFIGEIVGMAGGLLWARRRSRRVFERRLRRNGLTGDVIEDLVGRYHPPGLLRDLIREARS